MKYLIHMLSILLFAAILCSPAYALNILITNDDGFEAPNIKALYSALKAEGHDVIISATYSNQSGNSAMMRSFSPISITTEASEKGSLPAGSPGVGADPDPENYPDVYYVNGTPVMAVLYGIDIAAVKKWEAYPAW